MTEGLEDAIAALLLASHLDPAHPDLQGTPTRVAALWRHEFLRGYTMDPAAVLSETVRGEGQAAMVLVRDLPFHGLCPHHLLPFAGRGTVAYLPGDALVGFGRLAELLEGFSRRLTLQERIANDVVDALMQHLGARGAGCVLYGQHMCLRIPDNKHDASVVTAAFRGEFIDRPALQDQLWP